MTTTHGGKRKGAGRPPLMQNGKRHNIYLDEKTWDALGPSQSETIRQLVEDKMQFTFSDNNGDERFSGQSFEAAWGEWNPETQAWEPSKTGQTLMIFGAYGWSPFTHDPKEFGQPHE